MTGKCVSAGNVWIGVYPMIVLIVNLVNVSLRNQVEAALWECRRVAKILIGIVLDFNVLIYASEKNVHLTIIAVREIVIPT